MSPKFLILGVGNAFGGDDAVGLVVAQRIADMGFADVDVLEHHGEGVALMDAFRGMEDVILVDAVLSGSVPGTVRRWDAHLSSLPSECLRCSTHAFGVAEAIELARVLKELPGRFVVYGIEGYNFNAGRGLSAGVARAVPGVVESVCRELETWRMPCTNIR